MRGSCKLCYSEELVELYVRARLNSGMPLSCLPSLHFS
jgi:hypothetical protein